jgi:hypothetical protein
VLVSAEMTLEENKMDWSSLRVLDRRGERGGTIGGPSWPARVGVSRPLTNMFTSSSPEESAESSGLSERRGGSGEGGEKRFLTGDSREEGEEERLGVDAEAGARDE